MDKDVFSFRKFDICLSKFPDVVMCCLTHGESKFLSVFTLKYNTHFYWLTYQDYLDNIISETLSREKCVKQIESKLKLMVEMTWTNRHILDTPQIESSGNRISSSYWNGTEDLYFEKFIKNRLF